MEHRAWGNFQILHSGLFVSWILTPASLIFNPQSEIAKVPRDLLPADLTWQIPLQGKL